MKSKCLDCEHLDKRKKMVYGKAYLYGCTLRQTGYVSTWINTDTLLSEISCSTPGTEDDEEQVEVHTQEQLDIFGLLE